MPYKSKTVFNLFAGRLATRNSIFSFRDKQAVFTGFNVRLPPPDSKSNYYFVKVAHKIYDNNKLIQSNLTNSSCDVFMAGDRELGKGWGFLQPDVETKEFILRCLLEIKKNENLMDEEFYNFWFIMKISLGE